MDAGSRPFLELHVAYETLRKQETHTLEAIERVEVKISEAQKILDAAPPGAFDYLSTPGRYIPQSRFKTTLP